LLKTGDIENHKIDELYEFSNYDSSQVKSFGQLTDKRTVSLLFIHYRKINNTKMNTDMAK